MHHTPASSRRSPAEAHPDATLLALGREFDVLQAKWLELIPVAKAARRSVDAFLAERKSRNGRYTEAEFEAAWSQPGVDEADEAADEALCDIEELIRQIYNHRPLTIDGLALKARIVSVTYWAPGTYENDAALGSREDWPGCLIRDLIESVCALAGVDWQGRPVRASPTLGTETASDAALRAIEVALAAQLALPPAGSAEAKARFQAGSRAIGSAMFLDDAERQRLRMGDGPNHWTSDWVAAAMNEEWHRFPRGEVELAQSMTTAELSELLVVTLRRDLRMAEIARDTRWHELYSLAYPDGQTRSIRRDSPDLPRHLPAAAE